MDVSMDLSKMKVADLKKELKLRNLSTTGKRSDLLERLQSAIAEGVEAGADDDEEYDEDEILAGDDDDDDSKMTPMEEAAALAAAEKATATPARGRRAAAVAAAVTPATPKTPGRKLAIRRGALATPATPKDPAPAAATTPVKTVAAVKRPAAVTPKQTAIVAPSADTDEDKTAEPVAKVAKLAVTTADETKANGAAASEEAPVKSAKDLRAERFGIKSDDTAKQVRAERFGISAKPGKLSMDVGTIDVDKLKARAARFGVTTAKTLTKAETDEKKKARNERFGNGTTESSSDNKKDLTSEEAKAARAAKFGVAKPDAAADKIAEPLISASGKKLITVEGVSVDDVMKQKRAARFAAA